MAAFEDIVVEVANFGARDWFNAVSILSTPIIVTWVWPTWRGVAVAAGTSTLFWAGVCVWQQEPLDFTLVSTGMFGVFLATLCSALMFLRRLLPVPDKPSADA